MSRSPLGLVVGLAVLALPLTTVACSPALGEEAGETGENEAELRSRICSASARMLQAGPQVVSSSSAMVERAAVPDCLSGSRARTAVYKFRVPEPGVVKMAPIDTPGPYWTLEAFRGVQCAQPGRAGQWVGCDPRSASSGYRSKYFSFSGAQYARPGDDMIVAVAGIEGAELEPHELALTFEPSCGNGRAEDNEVSGQRTMANPPALFEECEDGGRVNGDGCSSTCKIESACKLKIPSMASGAIKVVDVPASCKTARLEGSLAAEATVVARINATSDDSVIATVLGMSGNTKYRGPRPTSRDEPWVTVTVGPKLPEQTTWACGIASGERCAELACETQNFLCRVRYESSGGKTYVRLSNASDRGEVSVDVRIDRNLAAILAYP